ncbi:zona pellucida sperm-binding protein 3 [Scomber scombrus]|uniref:Zona pellucida sperm-binding protein 3 n=1 Tax=Scomber scombrus TaxID=13677 RepID=A0AAV1NV31_SCOSC
MGLLHAGLVLLLCCSAYSQTFRSMAQYGLFVEDPELEWERMATLMDEDTIPAPAPRAKSESPLPEAKKLPEYMIVSKSKDPIELFKPEKGARPLPNLAKKILLPDDASALTTGNSAPPKLVEILCHVDRIYVRIKREVFKSRDAYKYLKLGACPVNQGTKEHYYLLHLLKTDCGYKKESNADFLSVSNKLRYMPKGPVLREMPFEIPLKCKYPRLFYSYTVGFYPRLVGGTVYKSLQPKSSFTLTSLDASGNEITGAVMYTLGQPMYFEAKTSRSGDQRMYINKCYMTASQSSNQLYTVIDNQGCMIDGKMNKQSKFLTGDSKMTQKFTVGAFVFKDLLTSGSTTQQLYMRCELIQKNVLPTTSSKACNYDQVTKKWKELYGDDSVCACCDTSCPLQPKATRNMVTSHSWKVDLNKDGSVEVDPRMKSFDTGTINFEDSDMTEHRDFLNYWDHDY